MHSTTTPTTEAIHLLKKLHRGEISAVETYQQALDKVEKEPFHAQLKQIHDEHRTLANELRQHIRELGVEPDQGSEVWGAIAKAVEGTAKLFGDNAAMTALKKGEEHGLNLCEKALLEDLPAECKAGIRDRVMPQLRSHVTTLDRLMSQR